MSLFPPRGKRGNLLGVSSHQWAFAAALGPLSLATMGGSLACRAESAERGARHWIRCTCSYISDFDQPGAAPIEVCSDGHGTEEIAATCTRNDGVGVPTSCHCDPTPRGPCDRRDRCRPGKEATP